jgi:hypothetical protein
MAVEVHKMANEFKKAGGAMKRIVLLVIITLCIGALPTDGIARGSSQNIYVNGVKLDSETIGSLEAYYGFQMRSGRYWYDKVSGLWGFEGGPAMGQIMPALDLGGSLKPHASGGKTGVFVNGRELHPLEVQYLMSIFGRVIPGRYWLNAQGTGGFVGGPPLFNMNTSAYGSASGKGYLQRTPGGAIGGDDNCFYYNHPNGSSVMNCE